MNLPPSATFPRSSTLTIAAALIASIAPFAAAQSLFIDYSLSFTEVYTGTTTPVANPNGLIEPGESMLLQMTISFDPPVGTIVSTPLGDGPVVGFGYMSADIVPHPWNVQGTWTNLALAPGWLGDPGGPFPPPTGSTLVGMGVWQWPAHSGVPPLGANPVHNIWRGVWTPHSYEEQLIGWGINRQPGGPTFGSLLVHYANDPSTGQPLYTNLNIPVANTQTNGVWVQIIPSPGAAAILLLSGLLACRRERAETDGDCP